MALASMLMGIFERPTTWEVLIDLMIITIPLWIAVLVGLLLGWSWRPKWANFFTAFPIPCFSSLKSKLPIFTPSISSNGLEEFSVTNAQTSKSDSSSSETTCINEGELRHLRQLVEGKDGGPDWIHMMERSTPTMAYQAWHRDSPNGPPQYRSQTVFEDATPEMVRDFFWDDEFRSEWDDMLISHANLEECSTTGTMIVHWVRKFPFFCSDREYAIGRRIWESDRSYYCVTKGVPYPSLPRKNKPRRVDVYYSSWCIRPAESRRDGQMTACEVVLFHHEDMGIPWEIAKLAVRQGMWGAVKKIDPGLRSYQKAGMSGSHLSHCAAMAHINTKVSSEHLRFLEESGNGDLAVEFVDSKTTSSSSSSGKQCGLSVPKLLVVGGAIAVACSIDKGLLSKAVIFGMARRFARIGRKL
ncbi:hypothetical protein V2J09_005046 [Rumex salicifolius]